MNAFDDLSELPVPAPTPTLHLRLARQAVPPALRLTGKSAARVALELAARMPLVDAVEQAIALLAEPGSMSGEQIKRIAGLTWRLIGDGLRIDDAVSVALHEPAHLRPRSSSLPPALIKARQPGPGLSGPNVIKLALELNHSGIRMDAAIVTALKRFCAPRILTDAQALGIVEAAQRLFRAGAQVADAFDAALRDTVLKAA